jgi:hypothetical protein
LLAAKYWLLALVYCFVYTDKKITGRSVCRVDGGSVLNLKDMKALGLMASLLLLFSVWITFYTQCGIGFDCFLLILIKK